MLGNVLVGQSGGPTSVINASLYGVVIESRNNKDKIGKVYGMVNGIEGFLKDNIIDLEKELDNKEALKTTPAAFLGSCRYKLPDNHNDYVYKKLFEKFKEMNIKHVLYIGGNDSMDTVNKLSQYAKINGNDITFNGIPKTIDNDLIITDHTPGFGSAAKYVATTVREISLDAQVYGTPSITIIEIMGRHAGWLTASSILARKFKNDNPTLIHLPEVYFNIEGFLKSIEEKLKEKKNIVVCVSEGIKDENGKFICEYNGDIEKDIFGHKNLTGCGKILEKIVKERLNIKTRSIELNVMQRCTVTNACLTDINEAVNSGRFGVKLSLNGETAKMICFNRIDNEKYMINYKYVDVGYVCNQEKLFPKNWIIGNNTDIHYDFINYVTPLIEGEVNIERKDGLPVFCYRK